MIHADKNILLEYSEICMSTYTDELTDVGYRVHGFYDPDKALRFCSRPDFSLDCFVVNTNVRGNSIVSGYDFINRLGDRKYSRYSRCPIIFLSVLFDESLIDPERIEETKIYLLEIPFLPQKFITTLNEILGDN